MYPTTGSVATLPSLLDTTSQRKGVHCVTRNRQAVIRRRSRSRKQVFIPSCGRALASISGTFFSREEGWGLLVPLRASVSLHGLLMRSLRNAVDGTVWAASVVEHGESSAIWPGPARSRWHDTHRQAMGSASCSTRDCLQRIVFACPRQRVLLRRRLGSHAPAAGCRLHTPRCGGCRKVRIP
jgi:hypothetical protein